MGNKLITCEIASKMLGLSRDYIRLLCWNGKIKAQKIGQNWVFTESAIKHIYRKRKTKKGIDDAGNE